ncbi:MAG TPA: carboxypeptidase regulatory-like domain-containing protein [Terriglobales bacterium]|nr:carboxypeptidase regulatory-like domain-containing protein [Terriglobales bacterium]
MAAILLFSPFSVRLHAQTPDTAIIRGSVVDSSHAAVSAAEITLLDRATSKKHTTATDQAGHFSIGGIPIGDYEVTTRKEGFAVATSEITLIGGATARLDVQLSPAAEKTQITVAGVAGAVRSDMPQLGDRLGTFQITETPLLSNRITYLPLLNAANRPALNQGDVFMNQDLFTTNGTGRRQAWFEVDGTNSVDLWGRQTIFTNLPVETLDEMSVLTSPFSAEYGGSAGSAINIVTKSGGDQYHGSVVGSLRPSATAASLSGFTARNATSGNQLTSDELYQPAFTLGGPIGHSNLTHFFIAGEYTWENKVSPITNALAPGGFKGKYRDWMALARLDRQLNKANNIFLRLNADHFVDTNPNGTVGGNNLPTVDRLFKRNTYTAELGETDIISNTWLNNLRAEFQLGSPITQFSPVIYSTQFSVPIQGAATFTTGTSQSALLMNHQFEINDVVSTAHSRSNLQFGAQIIHAHTGGDSKEFGGPIYLGQFIYNTCAQSAEVCESPAFLNDINNVKSYTQSYGNSSYTVDDTLWALFVQDDVRLRSNVTVNLGLRYERQTFTDSTKDFAPRIGFTWNPGGHGVTILRGGFGIYYSQIVDNSDANYALVGPTGAFNYTATPGQLGFPTSVAVAPLPAFPAGAQVPLRSLYLRPGRSSYYNQFLPTSTLVGYQNALLSPYTEQWTVGIERALAPHWILSADYVGSHTIKINRPLDVDPPVPFVRTSPGETRTSQAANCTRPLWTAFYAENGLACDRTKTQGASTSVPIPAYSVIQADVNDGAAYYNALNVNLSHQFSRRLQMLASYTWSHALDTVDPDIPGQNPNDPNFTGREELGAAIFDQRHRFVLSGTVVVPLKIYLGGIATLGSALPYNIVTGTTNSGDTGATTDRPVVNGAVISRNAGRGRPIYDVSPFIERRFPIRSERVAINLRAEAFNVFNHANFVGYVSTWGNGATAPANLGTPLTGITNQLPARSLQFIVSVEF